MSFIKYLYLFLSLFSYPLLYAQTKVLFIGDSLTAGYGIPKEKAYPYLVASTLKSQFKKQIKVINGSVSGSTTASAVSRLKWYQKTKPDILFLALGANDGLRGIDLESSRKNLDKAIKYAKELKIKVILAGMMIPPNYGPDYTKAFLRIYKDLSENNKVTLLPFLLEGVAAKKDLNLADGIHPNEKGHEVMAKIVIKYLRPLL
jgi:acyl-CoA thioesterase-1